MCIQTGPIGLPQVTHAGRDAFRSVNIILDHLGRPDVLDGPPYAKAASLFDLADLPNIYLKLTPRIFGDVKKGKASAETFFPRVVEAFGAQAHGVGLELPDLARHAQGDPGDGEGRARLPRRGRPRLDLRQDRAKAVSRPGLITALGEPGQPRVRRP